MDSTKLLDDEPGIAPVEVLEAADELSTPGHGDIAELAYYYWEARGEQYGSPVDDWLRAESELRARDR